MKRLPHFHQPETWDERSRDYQALAEPFTSRMAIALAERVGVRAGERVIDIACGPGALALHLARGGAEVTAIDHSEGMIGLLRGELAAAGLAGRVTAQAMDGQALAFPDGSFDVALSAFGIFLFPDNEAGLREAVRVLRSGGRVGLATWQGDFGAGPSLLFHEVYQELFPEREIAFPSAGAAAWGDVDHLARVMAGAGLEQVSVAARTERWTFPSTDWVADKADDLFAIFPSWTALTPEERDLVRRRIVQRLQPDLAVPSTALLATALKPLKS
jgi:SAM-dependent methyltransferase